MVLTQQALVLPAALSRHVKIVRCLFNDSLGNVSWPLGSDNARKRRTSSLSWLILVATLTTERI